MFLKYAKGWELEPGNPNYSTVMCGADKGGGGGGGGIITNVRDLGSRPSKDASLVVNGV